MVLEYKKLNVIPVNDYSLVLTGIDGQGWQLKKGDVIQLDYSGFCMDDVSELSIALLKNDIFSFGQRQSLRSRKCYLIIPEDGLYSLCFLTKY